MFCGDSITRSDVDPCAALLAAGWVAEDFSGKPGQYWFHAGCLRSRTHKSVPLYFLDLVENKDD